MKPKLMSDKPVLLAIRLRQLGDVLTTLGTLRAIKATTPDSRIILMVDDHYHRLLRNVDYVDMLLPQPPKIRGLQGAVDYNRFIDHLRHLNIDCVLDFHSNTRSALISYLSGAAVRVGFEVRGRKLLYTDVEPRAVYDALGRRVARTSHESAMALASRFIELTKPASVMHTIPVSQEEIRAGREALTRAGHSTITNDRVGLNPGNPYPAKAWSEGSFVELASKLTAQGRSVVVMWGPGEQATADRIVRAAGQGVTLAPQLALHEIAGFLKQLDALITIDSGLKHLAVAVGVPTVTLFGPTSPDEWHMGGARDRYLWAGLSCSPCRLLSCPFGTPCMWRLTPEDIILTLHSIDGGVRVREPL